MAEEKNEFEAGDSKQPTNLSETQIPQIDAWTPSRNDTFWHGDMEITYGEWWDAQAGLSNQSFAAPSTMKYAVTMTDYSGFLEAPDFQLQVIPEFKLTEVEREEIEQNEEFDLVTVEAEDSIEALEIAVSKFNQRIIEAHLDSRWTFGAPSVIDLSFDDAGRPEFEPRKATQEELEAASEGFETRQEFETEGPDIGFPNASF